MSAPSLPILLVSHWRLDAALVAELLAVAGLYLWATMRLGGRWPARRAITFLGGLACLLIALCSGLDTYDDRLLSVHMVQHMLLLLVAPLMVAAGRPALLLLRSLPPRSRRSVARALTRLRPVAGPWPGLAFYGAVLTLTHLAWFYDQTLAHPLLHDLEHLLYLCAGSLLLWPLLDADPVPAHRLGGLAKLAYLLIAMLPMAILGAYLNRHTSVVYAPYAATARAMGISALSDQAQAGAIMWVVGNTIMIGVGLWAVMVSLSADERRQQVRDARLEQAGPLDAARGPR